AIWHDPRCGKSQIVVDTCERHSRSDRDPLFVRGALIVVWPAGAQHTWTRDAFPASFAGPWQGLAWGSHRAKQAGFRRAMRRLLAHEGFAVLSVNVEALISQACREAIGAFASARKRLMAVGDEISSTANADTRRAKVMHNIGRLPFVVM